MPLSMSKRPTRAELLAARNKTVPDLIAPGLSLLFCGFSPGLYTAAISRKPHSVCNRT